MRPIALFLLSLLTACVAGRDQGASPGDAAVALPDTLGEGAMCRVGADGGPLYPVPKAAPAKTAERGIGGTGAHPAVLAERGIGGTGIGGSGIGGTGIGGSGIGGTGISGTGVADSGIGGTGIVGVITGFASVCVNGLEVQYDGSSVVEIDGETASAAALRAGQVVAIRTSGTAGAPFAQTIAVRREVAGQIESVELGSGTLTIAGQPVAVPDGTWGANSVRLGDWVTVSGLRRADGTLVASRVDATAAGTFTARGAVVRDAGVARIGQLVLSGASASGLQAGQLVTASGHYAAGRAQVSAVKPDTLFADPAAYFGAAVSHLVVQGFVHVGNGTVQLNGARVAAASSVQGKAGADGIAVVSMERKTDGSYTATGLRFVDQSALGTPRAGRGPRGDSMMLPRIRRSAGSVVASVGDGGGMPASSGPAGAAQINTDPADISVMVPPPPPQVAPATPPGTMSVARPLPEAFRLPVSPVFTFPVPSSSEGSSSGSSSRGSSSSGSSRGGTTAVALPGTSGDTHLDGSGSTPNGSGGSGNDGHAPVSVGSGDLISSNPQWQGAPAGSGQSKGSGDQQKSASAGHVIVPASNSPSTISLVTGTAAAAKAAGSGHVVTTGVTTGVTAVSSGKGKTTKTIGTTVGSVGATVSGRHLAR